ncbi:Gfo/Idh/MocA family protein [Edaphobacter bradus]|uniref:Gfo/Idh/MocA family protein n=1 Tax=Edaphobacter bradus TaxID=2259016 RepID=UPI0021E0C0C7|nr:Gfo/Idh/MocA family oxidoreductase [Edaphobacter bradus]
MNRREFVSGAACTLSALGMPTIVPASVFGANAPSNRLNVGFIGTGRQAFGSNLPQMMRVPGVQAVVVCDVDRWRMTEAQAFVNSFYAQRDGLSAYNGCATKSDFREVIGNPDIDVLMVSTPDHWHVPMGIAAAKAKKHFAMEKPISISVQQGRMLADAVKQCGVTARTDSEFRSLRPQNHAVELVRNGHVGKLERIEIVFPSDPTPVGVQPDMPIPPELDYDMWLGPTPKVPYTEKRVHDVKQHKLRPNWMRVDTYAQGMIANWGPHYFDAAQWANNSEHTGPVEVEGHGEFPVSLWNTMINFKIQYRYANGVTMSCEQTPTSKPSITYFGSDAWIKVDGYPGTMTSSKPELLTHEPEPGELDFSKTLWDKNDLIAAIREGRSPLEPIEVGHRALSIGQIGLIACRVGGTLHWNPEKEAFEDNNYADALLAAPLSRPEWALV